MKTLKVLFFISFIFINRNCFAQIITTFAGGGTFLGEGVTATTALIHPLGCAIDKHGNFYFIEQSSSKIRIVNTFGIISTVAGNGTSGFSGDGGLATQAQLNNPTGLAVDSEDNIYIADYSNYRIRKVSAQSGMISTYGGNGFSGFSGDNDIATSASLIPTGLCVDKFGNLYVSDTNLRIRKIDVNGIITTIAGNGISGFNGDNGPATNAELNGDLRLCIDVNNNLYVGCIGRIRKIDIDNGIITTFAGNGSELYNGDEISALSSQFMPRWITFDSYNNLYISDYGNQRIREIDNLGIIHTIAGNGTIGYNGDNVSALSASLHDPEGVVLDSCNNLFITDCNNYRIRKVSFNPSCYPEAVPTININTINIYPNPATTQLTVRGNINSIVIKNMLGQTLYSNSNNTTNTTINISQLPAGFYFVKVNDSWVQKVVKE